MTIVKQISLFDIQQLLEMESSHRFDAIFSAIDIQPIFQLFSKKTMRGAPRELNYGAMIQSLIARIVERIPTVKDLIKRLDNENIFSYGFKGHLAVATKSQYIVARIMTSGNVSDSKLAIPLLKKVNQLCEGHFTTGIFEAGYDYEPIYRQLTAFQMRSVIP